MRSLRPQSSFIYVCRRGVHDSSNPAQSTVSADDEIPVPKPSTYQLYRRPRVNPNILNEQFEADGYHDYSVHRLYDYYKIASFVKKLPTAAERINFVNPFERPWVRPEKKWHRVKHAPLHAPRRAWALAPVPRYYDVENFYTYITKMEQPLTSTGKLWTDEERKTLWEKCYSGLNFPYTAFEKRVTESLICALDGQSALNKDSATQFLAQFADHGQTALGHSRLFTDQRFSLNPRCESFWICAGFEDLYKKVDPYTDEVKIDKNLKYTGDHRHKLGELAFTMRDELVAHIRLRTPMTNINLSTSEFDEYFQYNEPFRGCLPPWIYNLARDGDHLWQCPGFDPDSGEKYCYGQVAIKNVFDINERIKYWDAKDDEEIRETRNECLRATAISTLFNWLNGQAHCAGWTQYTDDGSIDLTSQLVLSDGREFFFAAGQLRDISFNINWVKLKESNPSREHLFIERRPNRVIFDGPYNLFDEYDPVSATLKYKDEKTQEMKSGLNPIVLQHFLNMLVMN